MVRWTWVGVDLDSGVVIRRERCVPESVLRLKRDLCYLREALQEPHRHLIYQVLYGHTDELVEDDLHKVTHLFRSNVLLRLQRYHLRYISILPINVEVDEERAINALRQGRIFISREAGEGTARELDQLQPNYPAAMPCNHEFVTRALHLQHTGRIVV